MIYYEEISQRENNIEVKEQWKVAVWRLFGGESMYGGFFIRVTINSTGLPFLAVFQEVSDVWR